MTTTAAVLDGAPAQTWPYLGAGLLVLWTVREFLGYMAKRQQGEPMTVAKVQGLFHRLDALVLRVDAVGRRVDEVHEMHDHRDEDGVYVWHLRRSLVRTIQALEDNQGEQLEVLREHGAVLERLCEQLAGLLARPDQASP